MAVNINLGTSRPLDRCWVRKSIVCVFVRRLLLLPIDKTEVVREMKGWVLFGFNAPRSRTGEVSEMFDCLWSNLRLICDI